MRAIQESVAKSRQAALERTLQRQAEEQAAKEVHIAAAWDLKHKRREEKRLRNIEIRFYRFYDHVQCAGDWFYGDRNSSRGTPWGWRRCDHFLKKSCRNPMEPNSSLVKLRCIHIHYLSSPWLLQERCFQARCDLIRVRVLNLFGPTEKYSFVWGLVKRQLFAERLSEVAASGIGPDPIACFAIIGSSGRFSNVRHWNHWILLWVGFLACCLHRWHSKVGHSKVAKAVCRIWLPQW